MIANRIGALSVFPSIGTVVLKKNDRLIVFNPRYLLGKHSDTSAEVASKFRNIDTAKQLLHLIDTHVPASRLTSPKVELSVRYGHTIGHDALLKVPHTIAHLLPREEVRGHHIRILYCARGSIPETDELNIVLVPFNPAFGQGVEHLFASKYNGVTFNDFTHVYAIVTIYPGKQAPPMDHPFWNEHALLKEI